jgi:hypothetical protein
LRIGVPKLEDKPEPAPIANRAQRIGIVMRLNSQAHGQAALHKAARAVFVAVMGAVGRRVV